MEDDHGPLVGVEAAEAALELVAIGEVERGVGLGTPSSRLADLRLDRPPRSSPLGLAIARADEQAVEPGLEAVGVTQRRDVAPGGDERLLGGVLGPLIVAQDQTGDGVEPADREARQLRERLVIARHRPSDQVPPHRASVCAARRIRPYSQHMGPLGPVTVPGRFDGRVPDRVPDGVPQEPTGLGPARSPMVGTLWPVRAGSMGLAMPTHARGDPRSSGAASSFGLTELVAADGGPGDRP